MNIEILHNITGASAAKGVAVIIDVFRAFSTQAHLMNNHAQKIIPVGSIEQALAYKKQHPDAILMGERHGIILPGFAYGNSPSVIQSIDFSGKTIVHTTSAGTQGLVNASAADEILGASLLTAKATASYIMKKGFSHVSLVSMGLEGVAPAPEDDLCAAYIKSLLLGQPISLSSQIASLKSTSGKDYFDPAKQTDFPESDFYLCTDVDRFSFVLKYEQDHDSGYMTKVE